MSHEELTHAALGRPMCVTVEHLERLAESAAAHRMTPSCIWVDPSSVLEEHRDGVLCWLRSYARSLSGKDHSAQLQTIRALEDAWVWDGSAGWNVRHIRSIVAKPDSVPKRNRASVLAWLKSNPKSIPTIEETAHHINTLREAWGI